MILEVNSGHTSSQANEPLLCPLFNMDVTPAGYSLSHCENYFSIKMQELEPCPERAAKNTALWGTCHWGLSGHFPHPSAPPTLPSKSLTCWVAPTSLDTASHLSPDPALSESSCTGHHACFTDEQTEPFRQRVLGHGALSQCRPPG